jgi:osmotically-inducible protein OsmY
LAGLLVEPGQRRATHVIISRGVGRKNRVPISDVSFEGKVLHIAAHGDTLPLYLSDDELAARAREMLQSAGVLGGEERRTVSAHASGGLVTVRGNVRTKRTRELIEELMPRLPEAVETRTEVVDDIALELAIGRAIERAGLQRTVDVYARSLLGEVTFFGRAPTADAFGEIAGVASRVPGVRSVVNRVEAGAATAAP